MSSTTKKIIIGSRGSQLALWQSEWVKEALAKPYPKLTITITTISTTGDKNLDSSLSRIGDKGLFTKEIEHALLERKIDLAVHSLKDLPTVLPGGLIIGAITSREDVRDVFIAHPGKDIKSLGEVPSGGTIATGSLRRTCQLRNWRPDLNIVDLRGNLNTRLAKLDASNWDGMILARAGVVRLGLSGRITEVLPVDRMLPAVGQGALAVELRADDKELLQIVRAIENKAAMLATRGERALLHRLEGGCQVPIGTYGRIEDNVFLLDAMIGSLDGKKMVRGKIKGSPEQSEALGNELAETLLKGGGKEILAQIRKGERKEVPIV
ncbi:MAG TPA: hydroxymethylbilane synthase [Bacteroidota bacterium]|jgi:hydroxymethylbilane synthase|nr:hydroxymethylbilane synthase [Bacteroidota bacterium]